MGDRMRPIPFGKLMDWIITEYQTQGSIFGVAKLFRHQSGDKMLPLFGERMEAPFGPAAGPHTQLAQNIVCLLYTSLRYHKGKGQ